MAHRAREGVSARLNEDWRADALCAQIDMDIFFPEWGEPTAPAQRICGLCPVTAECLDYALRRHERYGVWGGVNERRRRRMIGGAA